MNARDVMTTEVVSVPPESSVSEIAKLLLDRGISAAPVVDADGVPLGMVSEGDLIGRDETAREARKDWWLALLAEGQPLPPEFLASLQPIAHKARDLMSAPLVTVGEEAGVDEIAKLLATHHIKRVPVLRDGHIVGIVSRADLLRALVAAPAGAAVPKSGGFLSGVFGELDDRFLHRPHPAEPSARSTAADQPERTNFSVGDFQTMESDFKRKEHEDREAQQRELA